MLGARLPLPLGSNCKATEENVVSFTANLCTSTNSTIADENKCLDDIDKTIEYVIESVYKKNEQPVEHTVMVGDLNVQNEALTYLAGYVAYKLKKANKICDLGQPTTQWIQKEENRDLLAKTWLTTLSQGGLLVPTDQLCKAIKNLEVCFNENYDRYSRNKNVFLNLFTICTSSYPSVNHDIVKEYLKIRLKIRIKYLNDNARTLRKQKWEISNAKKTNMFVESSIQGD